MTLKNDPPMREHLSQRKLNRELFDAARAGKSSDVAALIAGGADPLDHQAGVNCMTPLMAALESGSIKAVEMLIPISNTNATTASGMTALMLASSDGWVEAARLLLPVSDLSLVDRAAFSPLMHAAYSSLYSAHPNRHERAAACCALLAPATPLPNAENANGNTALSLAAEEGSVLTIQALLPHLRPTQAQAAAARQAALTYNNFAAADFIASWELSEMEHAALADMTCVPELGAQKRKQAL